MSTRLFDGAYSLAMRTYGLGIRLAAPFYSKANRWLMGRRSQNWDELELDRPVWIHCSSLGEFEQGRPFIEQIRKSHPDIPILLTFFSPSGYEVRKDYKMVDAVRYIDLDLQSNAFDFVEKIRPRLAVFVKYDFWYHHLTALKEQQIPYVFIAVVFRENHFLFSRHLKPILARLQDAAHLFVQDQESADICVNHGLHAASIVGDPRVDRVLSRMEGLSFSASAFSKVVIFGSLWLEDLEIVKAWIKQLKEDPDAQIIVAPHEVDDRNLRIFSNMTGITNRFSTIGNEVLPKHVLVDTIGDLANLYGRGTIAFIGGGFGHGIHNILEPAAAGLPILFGPKFQKFPEAVRLVEKNCAFPVNNSQEVIAIAAKLNGKQQLDKIRADTLHYLQLNQGATKKIFDWIEEKQFLFL